MPTYIHTYFTKAGGDYLKEGKKIHIRKKWSQNDVIGNAMMNPITLNAI